MSSSTTYRDRIKGTARLPGTRAEPAANNFRTHNKRQRHAFRGVLRELGIIDAVVVWVPDARARARLAKVQDQAGFEAWLAGHAGPLRLIDGHLRREEVRQELLFIVTDLDEQEAAKALATFDAVGDLADTDGAMLRAVMDQAGAPVEDGTRELFAQLSALANAGAARAGSQGAEEAIPGLEQAFKRWRPKRGQLWRVVAKQGEHRLLCGDCRAEGDVGRLLKATHVALGFTSPPYASQRRYDAASDFRPIRPDEFVAWFEPVQALLRPHLEPGGSWFVNIKEHSEDGQRSLYVLDLVAAHVRAWGWRFVDTFCWRDTKNGVPGTWPNRLKDAWEPVFHFSAEKRIKMRPRAAARSSAMAFTYRRDHGRSRTEDGGLLQGHVADARGLALPSNVLEVAAAADTGGHPAAFPPDLPRFFVRVFSDPAGGVYDPFMGSGTTVLVAHDEGRLGFGVEISPKYFAVVLERFAQRGLAPELVRGAA